MSKKTDTPITDLFESLLESADVPRDVMLKACRAAERVALDAARSSGSDTALINHRRKVDADRQKIKRDNARKTSTDSPIPANALYLTSGNIDSGIKDSGKKERAKAPESVDSKPKKPKAVATSLPDDWVPSTRHFEIAEFELKIEPEDVRRYAEEMKGWAKQEAHRSISKKADWDAAFSGWMRRTESKKPKRRPDAGPSMAEIAGGKFL
jgi:hypothetical protein